MRVHRTFITAFLLGANSAAIAAGDTPICADRPGKATATCTVPAGRWQEETGLADWSVQRSGDERRTDLAIGETVVKLGVSGRSDIEVDVTPWTRSTVRSGASHASASGFGDVNLLYKHRLTADDSAFELALLPFVKIPTAKRPLGNGKVEAGLKVPVSYSIGNSPLSIGATPELDWVADEDGRGHHAAVTQVVSLGWQVADRLNLSGELWGEWDWDPAGTVRQYSADVALAFLVRDDVQLDAGANFGFNRNAPDLELYGGVAVRF